MADNNTTKKRKYCFSETHSARKRVKAAKERTRQQARIHVGDQIERWKRLKGEIAANDEAVAKLLIDR